MLLKSRRVWLGLAITTLFMILFVYRVDLEGMTQALREANYAFLVPGILCYLIALWFRTIRWKLILLPLSDIRTPRLWPMVTIGYAANNLLPLRLGEVLRAYLLSQRSGVSKSAALGTIVVERVFDGIALLLLVAFASPFFSLVGLFQGLGEATKVPWLVLTLGLSIPFFALSAFFIGVACSPNIAEQAVDRALRLLPSSVRPRIRLVVTSFLAGVTALRAPNLLITIILISLPVWLAEAGLYFLVGLGFGLSSYFTNLGFMAAAMVITTSTSNLGTAFPSSGGGIGPFELFAKETLTILGVDSAPAAAFAIMVHMALLVPITALGLIYLWTQNLTLLGVARASQNEEPVANQVPRPQSQEELQ